MINKISADQLFSIGNCDPLLQSWCETKGAISARWMVINGMRWLVKWICFGYMPVNTALGNTTRK